MLGRTRVVARGYSNRLPENFARGLTFYVPLPSAWKLFARSRPRPSERELPRGRVNRMRLPSGFNLWQTNLLPEKATTPLMVHSPELHRTEEHSSRACANCEHDCVVKSAKPLLVVKTISKVCTAGVTLVHRNPTVALIRFSPSSMQGLPPLTEQEWAYRILELDAGSSSTLVDAAWRKLTDEWRPDRFASDPILRARAVTRVGDLDRAYQLLTGRVARDSSEERTSRGTHRVARPLWSFRRPLVATTAFAGMAIAAVLIARPSAVQKHKPTQVSALTSAVTPEVAPPAVLHSEIVLVAHAPLTVSASLVADGRILLPETLLHAGQTTTVPRLGPTYIKYSAGENLAVEVDGHRYAMPAAGPSRAKIN